MLKSKFTIAYWKKIGKITYQAALHFIDDKCMKMSASLAYYTIFSIGPLLLILIWCLGFFYGERTSDSTAQLEVFQELSEVFGAQVAVQIQTAMENLAISTGSNLGIIIGIGTLIFTSTTVFVEIQDSINQIWGIKPKPKKGWLKFILNRLVSFSMILGMGFLLIASLLINSIIMLLTDFLYKIIPFDLNTIININNILTFVIITVIFGFIFKVLPDAKVRNKDIIGGAIFTSLLFMLGRYGISLYLQHNAMASAYEAAGSVIILLLWVYYSAAILYYGAEFTKEYAQTFDNGIKPSPFAVLVEHTEIAVKAGEDAAASKGEIIQKKNKK